MGLLEPFSSSHTSCCAYSSSYTNQLECSLGAESILIWLVTQVRGHEVTGWFIWLFSGQLSVQPVKSRGHCWVSLCPHSSENQPISCWWFDYIEAPVKICSLTVIYPGYEFAFPTCSASISITICGLTEWLVCHMLSHTAFSAKNPFSSKTGEEEVNMHESHRCCHIAHLLAWGNGKRIWQWLYMDDKPCRDAELPSKCTFWDNGSTYWLMKQGVEREWFLSFYTVFSTGYDLAFWTVCSMWYIFH